MTGKDFDTATAALLAAGWLCNAINYPTTGRAWSVDWRAYFTRANPKKPFADRFALNADSFGSASFQQAIK